MTIAEIMKMDFPPEKRKRLIANQRKLKLLNAKLRRREKILNEYLRSNRVRKLEKAVQDATDKVSECIGEWGDIVIEKRPR